MSKVKINSGLASIALLASLFAGWQTLLIVIVLLFGFCEVDEKVKNAATVVVTFYVGYYIILLGWDLIQSAFTTVTTCIDNVVKLINSYLSATNYINITKLHLYVISPLKYIIDSLDEVITFMLTLTKFMFVIAVLTNKNMKENFISRKINEFSKKTLDYINNIDFGPQQPVAQPQMQPVQPQMQQPMAQYQQPMQNQPMNFNNQNNNMM